MADGSNGVGKPRVLILGGVGFIGRNLVHYLVKNDLASKIRVVDKAMPELAWLSPAHKEAFAKVEFKHANLINAKSVENVFRGDEASYEFVINCAAETKSGQTEAVYKEGIYKLSSMCCKEAVRHGAKKYVEISSARMYSSSKKPITEDTKCDPWTNVAKQKLAVEELLRKTQDLNYIILRPAIVYGPGDKSGLTPRLVVGAVYKHLKEKMKMLWTKDLKMNTVHVKDVCRAIWHVCQHGQRGDIYYLADKGDTTQGKIGEIVSELFNINHDYVGSVASNMAKLSLGEVVEDINEKHMGPWGEACTKDGIVNTPLNPYLDQELLYDKHLYVDGSAIEKTGFHYEVPHITRELIQEVLEDYVDLGLFPRSLVKST